MSVTLVEVRSPHHVEADTAEQFGHRLGVDGRTEQRRHILLGAAADDEGDAPVGKGSGAGADKAGGWKCGDQQAHVPSPLTRNFTSPMRPNPSGQSGHFLVRPRDAGHTSDCGIEPAQGTARRDAQPACIVRDNGQNPGKERGIGRAGGIMMVRGFLKRQKPHPVGPGSAGIAMAYQ